MEEEIKKEIAKKIKEYRKKNNISQKELSQCLDVSTVSISKWENGTFMPDVSYLYDMSKLFGVSIDSFLGKFSFDEELEKKEKKIIKKIKALIEELEKK